jgi:hypothetical protein
LAAREGRALYLARGCVAKDGWLLEREERRTSSMTVLLRTVIEVFSTMPASWSPSTFSVWVRVRVRDRDRDRDMVRVRGMDRVRVRDRDRVRVRGVDRVRDRVQHH